MLMRIRELRQQAGLKVTELAARVEVSHPTIVAWEHEYKKPTADKLPKLAAALGCTISELFADAS